MASKPGQQDANILKRLRDALETAAGQYGPVTDEQRNEWLGLVQEHDAHRWSVIVAGPPPLEPQDAGDSAP
jgi:hypothetical protein